MRTIIFFLTVALIVAGCSTTRESPTIKEVYGFDFREYTAKNFLFTPEKHIGNYESIGLIRLIMIPEVRENIAKGFIKKDKDTTSANGIKYRITGYTPISDKYGKTWYVSNLKPSDVIKEMYFLAIDMGADAVVNFQILAAQRNNGELIIDGYEVSGFAIKRN